MRLTLRTLLAYMDDILDPADQEELGRKIESSPFATELIHRSRDAVRRLRLSAPGPLAGDDDDLHGGDHNLDANTASEYLDNTLSPEAVADFERSCLEAGPSADMLLAEAASCHHVLTMVLGEPAEVDADLRQRMYALAQSPAAAQQVRIEPGHGPKAAPQQQPAAAAVAAPPVAARAPQVDPDEAGVPDYILAAVRQRRRTRRMVALTTGAVLVGGGLTWFFMSGGEPVIPENVAKMGDVEKISEGPQVEEATGPATTSSTGDVATTDPGGADTEAPAFTPPTDTASTSPPPLNVPTLQTPSLDTTVAGSEAAVTLPPELPTTTNEADTATPTAPEAKPGTAAVVTTLPGSESVTAPPVATPPVANGTSETTAEADAAANTTPPADDAAAATAATAEAGTTPPSGAGPVGAAVSTPSGVGPIAATTPATTGPMAEADAAVTAPSTPTAQAATGASTAAPPTTDAVAAEPSQPKAIGAYLGNNDLLLKFDPATKTWVRLAPRTAFFGGEQLMSLPTFRTHVVLSDVNAYLSGGAQIDLIPVGTNTGQAAEFALHIPYGQLLLNSGLNGNRIELSLVDQTRVVQLGPSSSLAIEVRRIFEPGSSAKRGPAPADVTWYLTSGTAKWGESGSAEAPASWTTIRGEDSVPVAIEELPAWVDHEPINDNERRARERVASALVPGEPVNTRLLEMSDPNERGRRTEDRALAARSGAYVGMYDALVTALGDVNQRASWREQIEALRQAIARDPTAVEGIHAAFALERGEEAADDLTEMLLGFDRAAVGTTRQEVQNGALLRLLRWMDDDDLIYRVLAAHNANEILGTRELMGYKPEQSASQRKRMLGRVWERFERGELMPPEVKPNE